MLGYIVIFVLGAICAAVAIFQGALMITRKEDRQREAQLEQQRKDEEMQTFLKKVAEQTAAMRSSLLPTAIPSPADTVKERLRRAVELTLKQNKLDTRVSDENLIMHNELELEKLIILRSILEDGFDPSITVRFNTGDQEQPLSTYVANIQKGLV